LTKTFLDLWHRSFEFDLIFWRKMSSRSNDVVRDRFREGSPGEYRRIIAFRNVLIHGYDALSHDVVWDIIQTKLPLLQREMEELMAPGQND
jgi:uncharacterized protein with HEPN domain